MPRQLPPELRAQAQMQELLAAAMPRFEARPPNPDNLPLQAYDVQVTIVEGPLDAREALRRMLANAPSWARSALALRLVFSGGLGWHPPLSKDAAAGQFALQPGGRLQDFEISTVCGPSKVIAFAQDAHSYIQFEVTAERVEPNNTKVTLTTKTAARTTARDRLRTLPRFFKRAWIPLALWLVFLAVSLMFESYVTAAIFGGIGLILFLSLVLALMLPPYGFMRALYRPALQALMPGVSKADPNYPAIYPDLPRKGFRQPKKKKLKEQGLI
ncbi:MAG TPA: DUF2867 domain-containing protein [bacterium]|nr:DUF2867 domain-containing protein [bacterium]